MTPEDLLACARDLLRRPSPATVGLWPRAAAVLGRQALEMALDELWRRRAKGIEECTVRAQLLCLPQFVDADLASRVSHAWKALSRACHHHSYELAPTAEELRGWLGVVDECATRSRS